MQIMRPISGWNVRAIGDLIACPPSLRRRSFALGDAGTVHEALIAAGELPHPDAYGGEDAQEWIGRTDWIFSAWCNLDRQTLAATRVDLTFERIDTIAEVRINGVRVASVADEFIPVRIAAKAFLQKGLNEIDVRLRGPVSAVEALERRYGKRPVNGDWTPFSFMRKSACNFGWDWGPRIPTVGIGRAAIHAWNGGRIQCIRPLVTACDADRATLAVYIDMELAARSEHRSALHATVEITAPDGDEWTSKAAIEAGETTARCIVDIPMPQRWYPRGFGAQPMYGVRVTLREGAVDLDSSECRVGLRSVRLDTSADAHGSGFTLHVNDLPVWCRGANWVPLGVFPRSATREAYDACIADAASAHCNMLRVWGGGIDEPHAFYDACDRLGILVWQDFAFACATYPEEAPYPELIEAEARHQVARLAAHPSVVLWCGGNEDILAWWSWGWQERLHAGQSWGRHYWLELLPRIVAELDPTRPYWPESPYSGSMALHPNDPQHGDRHTWDVKLEAYRTIVPRFCSEFGQQSPPPLGTLHEVLPEHELVAGSPELARRQRAWGGDEVQYAALLRERFPPLRTLDEFIIATQLLQARAYAVAIEWMRANAPRCMGALFWQWNDVWRGHSWSVLDVAGRPKPAFFAARRACAPECLTVVPRDEALDVVLCSAAGEHGRSGAEQVRVRLMTVDGAVQMDQELALVRDSAWTSACRVPQQLLRGVDPARSVIVAECADLRATHWFAHDVMIEHAPLDLAVHREIPGTFTLRSSTIVRDLCVCTDLLQGTRKPRASDGMVTLLPDDALQIALHDGPMPSIESLRACIRCANMVGR